MSVATQNTRSMDSQAEGSIFIIRNFINSHILEINTSMFHSSIVTEHHYIILKQKHVLEF
jgi:hypothetical protein